MLKTCVCLSVYANREQYADYPGGMKMNSVSSAVREVATRMNEVRLGHAHGGHMMASHPMDSHEHMDADYAHRGNAEMMASMRERMSMRGADMMAMHEGKMHGGYGNAMLMSLGARGIKAAAHHSELLPGPKIENISWPYSSNLLALPASIGIVHL